jgi:hypothetical protein
MSHYRNGNLFSVTFSVRHATISRLKIKSFLKLDTALHVSAYSAIIRCVETEGNCCAFRTPAIRVFVFTVFLNEVSVLVVPPSVPRVHSMDNTHTKEDNACGIEGARRSVVG